MVPLALYIITLGGWVATIIGFTLVERHTRRERKQFERMYRELLNAKARADQAMYKENNELKANILELIDKTASLDKQRYELEESNQHLQQLLDAALKPKPRQSRTGPDKHVN